MSDPEGGLGGGLLARASAAVVVCGRDRIVTLASPAAERLLGGPVVGHDVAALVEPAAREAVSAYLARLADEDPGLSVHCEVATARPPRRVLDVVGVNLTGDPAVGGVALTLGDVTRLHERIGELERRATTDALTGLANRLVFDDRLRRMARGAPPGCLAMIDLDAFKAVNDVHGHAAGDAVLAEVGRRLAALVPESGEASAARVGGEEFGILLPGMSVERAVPLVEAMLTAIARPHPVGIITASAGLAAVPHADNGRSRTHAAEEAFRLADTALYMAKAAGRDRLVVHTPALIAERLALGERIDALERERAALAAEARTDALTGVPNRRRLDEDLPALDAGARARGAPYGVVFIDLDLFGLVNKEWLQDAGDRTLQAVAATLGSALRGTDVLYRRGGEEFVALLADAALADALGVAERMRAALAERALPHPTLARVTASFGVACLDPARHAHAGAVVAAADAAMRRAKEGGRDRIVADARPD